MEKKTCLVELQFKDSGAGTFMGLASTYDVDLGGDRILPGAFTKTISERGGQVPLLWSHSLDDPIGVGRLAETAKGLEINGQLLLDIQSGRDAYARIKAGVVRGLSIGFMTLKESFKSGIREISEIKLFEVSLTCLPMNENAVITAVKQQYGADDLAARAQLRKEVAEIFARADVYGGRRR